MDLIPRTIQEKEQGLYKNIPYERKRNFCAERGLKEEKEGEEKRGAEEEEEEEKEVGRKRGVLCIKGHPPKTQMQGLTPQTCTCDLIGN